MKKIIITLTIIFIQVYTSAQPVTLQWAKKIGGTTGDRSRGLTIDAAGNVYTTGFFSGTADFDPGAGVFNLTATTSSDVFVSKLDVAGNFVWAVQFGGNSAVGEQGYGVDIDAAGNVYTTGYFNGIVDFDPGAGTFNLNAGSARDIFISKLDAAGNFVWALQMGGNFNGNHEDWGYDISIDAAGNIYSTGYFRGTADFDPGPGVFNLISPGGETPQVFISKLDAAGNFIWAKQLGGTLTDEGRSVTIDAVGNVYTIGSFNGTGDFDPGAGTFNLTSSGGSDVFVSKLDAAGDFVWAKKLGGTVIDIGYGITVDAAGNVYTTGYFQGTADFDPGAGTFNLSSTGGLDVFVSKLNASGDFVWAKQLGGATDDEANSITLDAAGNVYTTGYTNGGDFDPGPGVFILNSAREFVSKLNNAGDFVWAVIIGRPNPSGSSGNTYCMSIDAAGNIYTAGHFFGIHDFDPGTGVFNITSTGAEDIFVHKMSQNSTLPVTLISFTFKCNINGVQLQWVTATETNNSYFTVERSLNAVDWEKIAIINGAGNSSIVKKYSYHDKQAANGKNFYRLEQTDYDGQKKYSGVIVANCNTPHQVIGVYPNPAQDVISLNTRSNELLTYQIFNTAGQQVKSGMVNPDELIGIADLANGIYFLKCREHVLKFIKK